jgi:hypothetical protein
MKRILFDTCKLTFYGFGLGIGMSGSFYLFGLTENKKNLGVKDQNSISPKIENDNKESVEITSDIYN